MRMTSARAEMPATWVQATIGDVCTQPQYGYTTKASSSGDLLLLRTTDITSGTIAWETVPYCSINPDDIEPYLIEDGDIVVSRAGSVGVSHLIRNPKKAVFASYLIRFRPLIDGRYLSYFLESPGYWTAINSETLGIAVPNVNATKLKSIQVPTPPIQEQRRIVAKIEELFSELDKGIESLKTALRQLEVYRQSVLKHAFEGKLTAQWREGNKDKLEKPEKLIARVKNQRVERYELQRKEWDIAVEKWRENGGLDRKPPRPRLPSFPEPFTGIERTTLPEIFGLWRWVKVGELFSIYVGATPSRKNRGYWNGPINWITSGEVRFAPINKTNETVTLEGLKNVSTEIHPIGTVMLAMIGEGKTRGQAAVTNIEACHNQNTAAIRVSESEIPPEYVYYYLLYRYEDTRRVGSGNNQKALNKERVSNLPIPLPPVDEQAAVVRELDKLLSVMEQLDREIRNRLTSVRSLRQAILKKAFAGQLVAQDPGDEPASVLLEKIRTKSAKAGKSGPTARRNRKAKTAA